MQERVVIRRLGDLEPQATIHAYCKDCAHWAELDVPRLLAERGDLFLKALYARLRCSACGSRKTEVRHGWDVDGFHYLDTEKAPDREAGGERGLGLRGVPGEPGAAIS